MSENTNERLDRYAEAVMKALECAPTHPRAMSKGLTTWCREHFVASRDGNSILKGQWTDEGCPVAVAAVRAVMAVADAELADPWAEAAEYRLRMEAAEAEVAIYKAEANAERIHAEDGPCAVCDHLMLEDQIDRAEAAEAERDRARSLAATLEARLVEAEATLWDHPDCIGECACAKNAVDAVLNPKGTHEPPHRRPRHR